MTYLKQKLQNSSDSTTTLDADQLTKIGVLLAQCTHCTYLNTTKANMGAVRAIQTSYRAPNFSKNYKYLNSVVVVYRWLLFVFNAFMSKIGLNPNSFDKISVLFEKTRTSTLSK